MNELNASLLKATSVVLGPFASWPAQVALIVLGGVAGILAAIVFRYTSNQAALRRVADQVRASLLAMRLFKDDLRSVFAAQLSLFKASGLRLWHSLPPMVVLIIPFVFLLTQLAMWYEFRPLTFGQQALVEVQIAASAWSACEDLSLAACDEIAVTGPVRNPHDHLFTWRISPQKRPAGEKSLRLRFENAGKLVGEKEVVLSNTGGASELIFVSARRAGPGFWDRLLNPGEQAFPKDSPIRAISIDYEPRTHPLFGVAIPWWLTFFIASILAAFLVKPLVKVEF